MSFTIKGWAPVTMDMFHVFPDEEIAYEIMQEYQEANPDNIYKIVEMDVEINGMPLDTDTQTIN